MTAPDADGAGGARRPRPLEFWLSAFVAAVLFVMMSITFVDVTGRFFFGRPLPAAYEMTELLLAICIFRAMPLTTLKGEHIRLSLFDRWFTGRRGRVRTVATSVFCGIAVLGLAVEVLMRSIRQFERGDHTLFLQAPLAPIAAYIAVMAAVTGGVFLFIAAARRRARNDDGGR